MLAYHKPAVGRYPRHNPKPATAAGRTIARRFRVNPALADLVARLAGLGGEAR